MNREDMGVPCPPLPDGFPAKIFVYGWFKRNGDWHPREVDELYIEELDWIPVYEAALVAAEEYISRTNEFHSKRAAHG
jgi:hypothetical protein